MWNIERERWNTIILIIIKNNDNINNYIDNNNTIYKIKLCSQKLWKENKIKKNSYIQLLKTWRQTNKQTRKQQQQQQLNIYIIYEINAINY